MPFTPVNFGQIASSPNASTATPTPIPQPQGLGSKILTGAENIGKDAFNTLIGTPATRVGQLAGNLIAPALGIPQKNIDYANSQPQSLPLGLGTVAPQKDIGKGGGEQITGQALKSASYLAPGMMAEGVASKGIIGGAFQGAKLGAVGGALGGAGNSMEQGGSTSDVIGSGISGAGTGALIGGALGGATGAVGNIWDKAYGNGGSYQANLQNATQANSEAGAGAVNSIHEASNTMSDVTTGAGNQYEHIPNMIAKTDPKAGTVLSADILDKMNTLKDTKAWSLPNSIRDATSLNGEIKLNPQDSQDLIKSLNDLKFNSKGDVIVNQQVSNLVNEVKTAAQKGMGHVVDSEGNSAWARMSQDYQRTMDAKEAMSNLIPLKKFQGEMLDPTEVNSSINKMMKMMETPEGKASLIRANTEFKNATGYDLLNDPMGAIQKLAESNSNVAKALKGGYGHQFLKGLENPTVASRRLIYAVTTILGITGLGTAFRKQIGNFISGQ